MLKKFLNSLFSNKESKEAPQQIPEPTPPVPTPAPQESQAPEEEISEFVSIIVNGTEYVDLGLSNGMFVQKEIKQAITYKDMVAKNSDEVLRRNLPTYDEAAVMINECEYNIALKDGRFKWLVKGPNGNYIYLPITSLTVDPNAILGSACYWIYDGPEGSMHPFMMVNVNTITIGMAASSQDFGFFSVLRKEEIEQFRSQ